MVDSEFGIHCINIVVQCMFRSMENVISRKTESCLITFCRSTAWGRTKHVRFSACRSRLSVLLTLSMLWPVTPHRLFSLLPLLFYITLQSNMCGSWAETISNCASVSKRVVLQWTFHIYENEFDLDNNEAVGENTFSYESGFVRRLSRTRFNTNAKADNSEMDHFLSFCNRLPRIYGWIT